MLLLQTSYPDLLGSTMRLGWSTNLYFSLACNSYCCYSFFSIQFEMLRTTSKNLLFATFHFWNGWTNGQIHAWKLRPPTHIVWKLHKMSHLNFGILAFSINFVLIKLTCLVTLFDRKLHVFKTSPNMSIFCICHELLSTQNVNVVRFAHNVEWEKFWGENSNSRYACNQRDDSESFFCGFDSN